jgi:hypothetical protein
VRMSIFTNAKLKIKNQKRERSSLPDILHS